MMPLNSTHTSPPWSSTGRCSQPSIFSRRNHFFINALTLCGPMGLSSLLIPSLVWAISLFLLDGPAARYTPIRAGFTSKHRIGRSSHATIISMSNGPFKLSTLNRCSNLSAPRRVSPYPIIQIGLNPREMTRWPGGTLKSVRTWRSVLVWFSGGRTLGSE